MVLRLLWKLLDRPKSVARLQVEVRVTKKGISLSQDAEKLSIRAGKLFRNGDLARAEEYIIEWNVEERSHPFTPSFSYRLLGFTRWLKGDVQGAVDIWQEARENCQYQPYTLLEMMLYSAAVIVPGSFDLQVARAILNKKLGTKPMPGGAALPARYLLGSETEAALFNHANGCRHAHVRDSESVEAFFYIGVHALEKGNVSRFYDSLRLSTEIKLPDIVRVSTSTIGIQRIAAYELELQRHEEPRVGK